MLAPKLIPRSPKQLTLTAVVFLSLFYLIITQWYSQPQARKVQLSAFDGHLNSPENTAQLCAIHSFPPFLPHIPGQHRRVYDLFLLSTELDWLEIRLNTLYNHIDYFVIVESDRTFTGLPKPLYLRENWSKFATFHHKIIYVVVEDKVSSARTWDHEDAFRNALLYETFPQIAGTEQEFQYGDALMVSDIDEIPRPETIMLLRYCNFPDRLTLRSHFYYYSFQWLHRGEQWAHPQVTTYRGISSTIAPVELRNGDGGSGLRLLRPFRRWRQKADLLDAAWHCSSCFRTVKEMQTKMASFSHTRWNTEDNRDSRRIIERVRSGLDLFGREGEIYDKVVNNLDVPPYLVKQWERYGYLLDRDGPEGGFEDTEGWGPG